MSHPDPCYDPDNSYEDDEMDSTYDDYYDFNDSMDGDHDSAMDSIGWGDDDSLAYGGGADDYGDW